MDLVLENKEREASKLLLIIFFPLSFAVSKAYVVFWIKANQTHNEQKGTTKIKCEP